MDDSGGRLDGPPRRYSQKPGDQMSGQGSAGNVIAALASFFVPGLGQLLQGRLIMAAVMFVLAAVLWVILLGWIIHLWSIIDAAVWKPRWA
jgi:TM2 domain-containing membrane protein YozV